MQWNGKVKKGVTLNGILTKATFARLGLFNVVIEIPVLKNQNISLGIAKQRKLWKGNLKKYQMMKVSSANTEDI